MKSVHENDKTIICLDCDLTFASNRKMLNHRRVHNVKSYQYDEVREGSNKKKWGLWP